MAFDPKQAYLDSPPTKQSRLVTCACPYRRDNDGEDSHNITVVWKGQGEKEEPQVLIANASYLGKPLPIRPGMIKNYNGDHFPGGMFYIVCSCQLKPGQKPPYRGYEVADLNSLKPANIPPPSTTSGTGSIPSSTSGTNSPSASGVDTAYEDNISKMMRKNQSALMQVLNQIEQDLSELAEDMNTTSKNTANSSAGNQVFSHEQENAIRRIVQEIIAKSETRLADLLHAGTRVTRADLLDRNKPRANLAMATQLEESITGDKSSDEQAEVSTQTTHSNLEKSEDIESNNEKMPTEISNSVAPTDANRDATPHEVEPRVAIRMRRKSMRQVNNEEDEPTTNSRPTESGDTINSAFAKISEDSNNEDSDEAQHKYNPSLGVTKVIEATVYKKMFEENIGQIDNISMIEEPQPKKNRSIGLRKSDLLQEQESHIQKPPNTEKAESSTTQDSSDSSTTQNSSDSNPKNSTDSSGNQTSQE